MNKNLIDRYKADVDIPDVVWEAEKSAFEKVILQAKQEREEQKENTALVPANLKKKRNRKWLALAFVAVFVLGTLTAGAAAKYYWFPTVEEDLNMSDADKELIQTYDMAVPLGETVTQNGVAITAEEYITDGRFVYIIFSVDGLKPVTEEQYIWLLDIYCGITGSDGTFQHYLGKDEETGKYLIVWTVPTSQIDSLDGSYAFVDIGGIGVYEDGENGQIEQQLVPGDWSYKWQISANVPTMEIDMKGAPIGDTGFFLENISFTYFMGHYDASMSREAIENHRMIILYGYQLKDGTIVQVSPWGDINGKSANIYHGKVIDYTQIESLLFLESASVGTLPADRTEDDYIVVDMP